MDEAIGDESEAVARGNEVAANGTADIDVIQNLLEAERVIVPIIFGLIFIFGLLGNGLLLFLFARHKKLQTIPNMYILNLAVGDVLLLFISVPFSSYIYVFKDWVFGDIWCKINESLQTVSMAVSILTLTVLSVERYHGLVQPFYYRTRGAKRQIISCVVIIWLTASVMGLPDVIGSHVQIVNATDYNKTLKICSPYPREWGELYPKWYTALKFVVLMVIPFGVILTHYALMMNILCYKTNLSFVSSSIEGTSPPTDPLTKSPDLYCKDTNTKEQLTRAGRRKVALVILGLSGMFLVCWFPRHVYLLWYHFDPGFYNFKWHILKVVSFCLTFLYSALNPLTIYSLDRKFRDHLNRTLSCSDRCGHTANVYNVETTVDNINYLDSRENITLDTVNIGV